MDELEKINLLRDIRDSLQSIAVVFKLINFILYVILTAGGIAFLMFLIFYEDIIKAI
ncbi:MAG: hypothetical protein IIA77_06985 [Proteobacteria bacterium]|nr:hypothetical protein [Pseudomonadota bacterium]